MSLTALELKNQGNQYYSTNQSSLAIESYTQAIKLLHIHPEEDLPLYLLYSNRAAAHIQDEDYYCGYEDAKESLKLKKDGNFKGFYRAAVCTYHLGFIEKSNEFIKEATENHQQNLLDYLNLKLLIEKKIKCMKKYRKPNATAKASLKHLKKIIQKDVSIRETSAILYHIRYLLRAFFEKTKDRKMMNIDHDDLGLALHRLAVKFNSKFKVEKLIKVDPIFEDLILNEMPDVGSLRLKAYEQRKLPEEEQDDDLDEKAEDDLTAYEFSFFVNNILASLVVHSSDEKIALRALKQLHRLTTIDLYRQSLGDALSDAINTYIYSRPNDSILFDKLISNGGIEIFFYDYIEAACQMSALEMIKNINADQWRRQSLKTIEFVIKQISKKIQFEDMELIEPKEASPFEIALKAILNFHLGSDNKNNDDKENFNIIVNVLTKISMVFGKQPFIQRSLHDPLFLFVNQIWFEQFNYNQHRYDIPFLLNGWSSILTQWLKLDYSIRRQYIEQISAEQRDDHY